ncbi:MAG TPA: YggT family protein [Thermomicrobiales bacterium]|nr:YggT family protein [Thermomicrobiales bacterium]
MPDSLITLISYLFNALTLLLVARALLSWFDPGMRSSVGKILVDITEPLLGPIRRMIPSAGGLDFSPIIAIILLQFVERIVLQALY